MIKFKKKIQFYFKKIVQLFFILIYGSIKYERSDVISNNIIKKKLKILFQILKVPKIIFLTKLRMVEFIRITLNMLQLLMVIL